MTLRLLQVPARLAQQIAKPLFKVSPVLAVAALVFFWLTLIVLLFCLGPVALAYDLNHLVPLATHRPLAVSWANPAVFICGVLSAKFVIPVTIIVWLLVSIGVLS